MGHSWRVQSIILGNGWHVCQPLWEPDAAFSHLEMTKKQGQAVDPKFLPVLVIHFLPEGSISRRFSNLPKQCHLLGSGGQTQEQSVRGTVPTGVEMGEG